MTPEQTKERALRLRVMGFGLQRIFDQTTSEPVPFEFLELLRKIDGKHEN